MTKSTITHDRVCPDCGGIERRSLEEGDFFHGEGDEEIALPCLVPAWQCDNCDFKYADGEVGEAVERLVLRVYFEALNKGRLEAASKPVPASWWRRLWSLS